MAEPRAFHAHNNDDRLPGAVYDRCCEDENYGVMSQLRAEGGE